MNKVHRTAIVLAGGSGSRMGSDLPKQFLNLAGKPILCYSLEAFENSIIDDIILVVGSDWMEYCKEKILVPYGYGKVSTMVAGGKERYDSVYEGLKAIEGTDYVYIHDGARPMVDRQLIETLDQAVQEEKACIAAVPCKDTIKVVDQEGYALSTPDRKSLWAVQTPQVFSYDLIMEAYETMMHSSHEGVTDDAMVVENYGNHPVKMVKASYENIKITTPDDLSEAESYLAKRAGKNK